MIRPFPLPLFVLAAALGAGLTSAAESSPLLKEPAPAGARSAARPTATRAISPQVAGLLAAAAPTYSPSEAPPAQPVEAEPRQPDQPRNRIIRLSPYIVRERPPPELKERHILTAKGRLDLALQRHPGLRLGSLGPLNNNRWAHAMLEEEFALERRKEMLDLLSLLPAGPHKPEPFLFWRPWFTTLRPSSSPQGGLVVPWEKK
ncbi:MAG: hypothetical protein Q8N18_17385 [Opitutaceae bacterium]|nr:hypothetical protein [Opitutaceae bacterium]